MWSLETREIVTLATCICITYFTFQNTFPSIFYWHCPREAEKQLMLILSLFIRVRKEKCVWMSTADCWCTHKGLRAKLDLVYNSWSYLPRTKSIQQGLRDSVTLLVDTKGLPDCCASQSSGVSLTSWSPLPDCKLWEGRFTCLSCLFLYPQNLMHRSEEKVWIQDNIGPLRSASRLLLFYWHDILSISVKQNTI